MALSSFKCNFDGIEIKILRVESHEIQPIFRTGSTTLSDFLILEMTVKGVPTPKE